MEVRVVAPRSRCRWGSARPRPPVRRGYVGAVRMTPEPHCRCHRADLSPALSSGRTAVTSAEGRYRSWIAPRRYTVTFELTDSRPWRRERSALSTRSRRRERDAAVGRVQEQVVGRAGAGDRHAVEHVGTRAQTEMLEGIRGPRAKRRGDARARRSDSAPDVGGSETDNGGRSIQARRPGIWSGNTDGLD